MSLQIVQLVEQRCDIIVLSNQTHRLASKEELES